ncbi:unnamed protein product [Linum trigynum]|uniref:Uncharacterized protein n=1 Tax=Linum trigynum TaxID=586398 RepID=A0AAV2DKP8_9ROSI
MQTSIIVVATAFLLTPTLSPPYPLPSSPQPHLSPSLHHCRRLCLPCRRAAVLPPRPAAPLSSPRRCPPLPRRREVKTLPCLPLSSSLFSLQI